MITSFISTIPFSLIFWNYNTNVFIINFLRVLRLIKLLPLYRVLNYFKRFNVKFVRIFEIILAYYVAAHIIAGVMLCVGLKEKSHLQDTWMNKIPIPLPANITRATSMEGVSQSTMYIHALYFAANTISHVAVGDLTSVSTNERILNAFLIWCMTFFYALLFANISSVFNEGNNFLDFNSKYQYVMHTIPKDKLSQSLNRRINTYYEYLWSVSQGYDEEKEILRKLPS